MMWVKRLCLHP